MDSIGSEATSALQEDVNILKQELRTLEAKREALLQQIEHEEKGMAEETASLNLTPTTKIDKDQKRMQDILTAYRLTGVTMFNASEMEETDWSEYTMEDFPAAPQEVGIRFETFANAKYHEPYYVMVRKTAPAEDTSVQEIHSRGTLHISKHTIPHSIPLREIEKRYLNRDMSTFTHTVSQQLQEFVERRESGRVAIQDQATGTTGTQASDETAP